MIQGGQQKKMHQLAALLVLVYPSCKIWFWTLRTNQGNLPPRSTTWFRMNLMCSKWLLIVRPTCTKTTILLRAVLEVSEILIIPACSILDILIYSFSRTKTSFLTIVVGFPSNHGYWSHRRSPVGRTLAMRTNSTLLASPWIMVSKSSVHLIYIRMFLSHRCARILPTWTLFDVAFSFFSFQFFSVHIETSDSTGGFTMFRPSTASAFAIKFISWQSAGPTLSCHKPSLFCLSWWGGSLTISTALWFSSAQSWHTLANFNIFVFFHYDAINISERDSAKRITKTTYCNFVVTNSGAWRSRFHPAS